MLKQASALIRKRIPEIDL